MALAFKRAVAEADKAAAGYYSGFKEYCGFEHEKPIEFDWDSAKAIEGSSKHNSNSEELPKCVTIAKYIAGNPNYLYTMAQQLGYKADKQKELAWAIQKKHFNRIIVHFDDKNTTKKGECTWTNEVKDGALHATMHWNFDSYMGTPNYEEGVANWICEYLDEKEALWFEIEKAKVLEDVSSGKNSSYFGGDGAKWLSETVGKAVEYEVNWDEIRAIPGKGIEYSNKPPVSNNYLMAKFLNDGRGMYCVRSCLDYIVKDDMGKEAFNDAFTKVRIEIHAADAHNMSVRKDGKTLIFAMKVKVADNQNFSRSYEAKEIAKLIENLL